MSLIYMMKLMNQNQNEEYEAIIMSQTHQRDSCSIYTNGESVQIWKFNDKKSFLLRNKKPNSRYRYEFATKKSSFRHVQRGLPYRRSSVLTCMRRGLFGRAMWADFWFYSVFYVFDAGFRKDKENWDIVQITKAPLGYRYNFDLKTQRPDPAVY